MASKRKIEVRKAQLDDVPHIAERMRHDDRDEIAAFGVSPETALLHGLRQSLQSWTGTVDDEPVCMFGFNRRTMLSEVGIPWLLGTDRVREIPYAFLRKSRRITADVIASGTFSRLENLVSANNELSIRWLRWLGFSIHPDYAIAIGGRTFYLFTMGG